MRKLIQWIVEIEHYALQRFNRQMDAKRFEQATNIAELIVDAVDASEVVMCYDGEETLRSLCIEGLSVDDIEKSTVYVFLDTLKEALADWTVTGHNVQIEQNIIEENNNGD